MKIIFLFLAWLPLASKAQNVGQFKEATAFIYAKDSLGNPVPNGTCFIIGIPSKSDTLSNYYFYVTARHVLENKDGSLMKDIFIRMNTKDSQTRFIYHPIVTSGPNQSVFFHKDLNVDIAVLIYSPGKSDYDFKVLAESFITGRDEFNKLKIEEGTEVFFTGLFVPYVGERKIFPICRFGHISLFTNEKINWIGKEREMFLMEISSYGGNSGAPVYIKITETNGSQKYILGGILSGTFRDVASIAFIQTNNAPVALYNNGISGVTPVYLLHDILNSIEFRKLIK